MALLHFIRIKNRLRILNSRFKFKFSYLLSVLEFLFSRYEPSCASFNVLYFNSQKHSTLNALKHLSQIIILHTHTYTYTHMCTWWLTKNTLFMNEPWFQIAMRLGFLKWSACSCFMQSSIATKDQIDEIKWQTKRISNFYK